MQQYLLSFCLFCVVLVAYLHLYRHWKTSQVMEFYEIDNPTKDRWEQVCELHQPTLFSRSCPPNLLLYHLHSLKDNLSTRMVSVRSQSNNTMTSFLLPLTQALALFEKDTESPSYFFDRNRSVFQDVFARNPDFMASLHLMRPPMALRPHVDILAGSKKTTTPWEYKISYRNYFVVTSGKLVFSFLPYDVGNKCLVPQHDYDEMHFWSPVPPNFDERKPLICTAVPGQIVFVPPYWWISIEFAESNSAATLVQYDTVMSSLSTIHYTALYYLQLQNIRLRASLPPPKPVCVEEKHEEPPSMEDPAPPP